MHEVLTVAEVAKWLRVHPLTVYRLLHKRKIPAFRVGTDWRFTRRDLELWLEQITVMGRPTPCRESLRSADAASRRR